MFKLVTKERLNKYLPGEIDVIVYFECPYCFSMIKYYRVPPSECDICCQFLPDVEDLKDSVMLRSLWHGQHPIKGMENLDNME